MSLQGCLCKLSLCTAVYLPIFIGPRGNPEPHPTQKRDGLFGNILYEIYSPEKIILWLPGDCTQAPGCALFSLTEEDSKTHIKIHQEI